MIYGGCSGYSFREWVGRFYPPKTPSREFLRYYAAELGSVEINHTFRRFPKIELIENLGRSDARGVPLLVQDASERHAHGPTQQRCRTRSETSWKRSCR